MPVVNPDLKTVLAAGDAFGVFEFDDPGGTTHKYAGGWISSAELGNYKGFIPKGGWGSSPRIIPLRGDRIQNISTNVTIDDKDKALDKLVNGQYARQIRGADARIRIVSPNIDPTAYHLRFSGQLVDYGKIGKGKYRFQLGTKAPELDAFLSVPIITKASWPDADGEALGNRTPLVYGIHDSASLGSRGMLPTYYVDTTNFRYLVSHQYIKSIDNVYVDNVVQASGWSEINLFIEGQRYTLVEFTTDQGDAVITVDATGATEDGDPASTAITNPVAQFREILANYVFNSWNGVPANQHGFSDSPLREDLLYQSEIVMNSRGQDGSIAIPEKLTGLQFINIWSSQYMPAYWMPDATIAVRPDPWYFTEDSWDADRQVLIEGEHFRDDFIYKYSSDILKDEWNVGFLYSEADGAALERIRVKDTLREWNISDELDLTYMVSDIS